MVESDLPFKLCYRMGIVELGVEISKEEHSAESSTAIFLKVLFAKTTGKKGA